MASAENEIPSIIGTAVPRIDGPLKVSGNAIYTADFSFPEMVYAVPVCSTVGKGSITKLDTSHAEKMSGVVAILHRENIGRLYRSAREMTFNAYLDERRPPFENDLIYYNGQYVALAVAGTFEQAQAAAAAVQVVYRSEKPEVDDNLELEGGLEVASSRGDTATAFASAPVKIEETYVTPVETHNPIELHASVSIWDGSKFTLYETTQGVVNHRAVLAQVLGVPIENVRVISRFLGSGFGGKLFPWPHSALAAAASRKLNRPVKLVLSRGMMFSNVGHRPLTQQKVELAATPEGKLVSFQQDYLNHTSILDDYKENCGEATPYLYSVPNLRVASGLVRRNVGTPTAMRGPGAVPGLFATESAMDELAIKLKMDPVEFRLLNEPEKDESNGLPFSSRHFQECLRVGATKFGWSKRNPAVSSMREGDLILGWGTAACSWVAARFPCEANVELRSDGTVRVACATQDIGTGTYTILAQIVSAKTGVPLNRISVVLGDTSLPPGPISGGSMATASVIPAVCAASDQAIATLLFNATKAANSPFSGKAFKELALTNGRIHEKNSPPDNGIPYETLLRNANVSEAKGSGHSEGSFLKQAEKYSTHSFGAHFVEVTWDPGIARLRVRRVVTVIDAGRIINPRPARNQIEGAIVMGIGMALFEETRYDSQTGHPINNNLADYCMAVNADTPEIDVTFLDHPDTVLNEYGARGVGEIGLAGIAPAITAAVYHASGVRIRRLPVQIEDLLGAPA
ncbi:MAG: xanthine dehydrogenase family protein molybdopterin-binding subunit [Verrucomicrobia bacterium]|nr:xanthine dehydrogenase family protein molybdopterin-binding subunit [Verrucomicrobiota bacterium]